MDIVVYETPEGERPFAKWFKSIDRQSRNRITIALGRLQDGNLSSLKSLGGGLWEMRLHFGAGYRLYLGRDGNRLIVLFHGGTKRRQDADIRRARELWNDYWSEK